MKNEDNLEPAIPRSCTKSAPSPFVEKILEECYLEIIETNARRRKATWRPKVANFVAHTAFVWFPHYLLGALVFLLRGLK